jgi:membrane associated rhomboid family serine protease
VNDFYIGGKLVEAQMEIQNYLEQGRAALAQGQAREAAIAYANGAQLEPNNPAVHLGLAQANLALGNFGVVEMASRQVLELQPENGHEAKVAQALLDLLEHRYDRALQNVDAAIKDDPSVAYVHALRSYLLRANGQDYDANLARARATRLSYGGRFDNCFPPLEPASEPNNDYSADPASSQLTPVSPVNKNENAARNERETVPNWSRPTGIRRQAIRTRFFLNQNPGLITNAIITITIVLYLLSTMNRNIFVYGAFFTKDVQAGQIWRFVTSLFIYPPVSLISLLISMLSLFFVGRVVEMFYGPYRYLGIYFLAGILSNVACWLLSLSGIGQGISLGPFGSLLGIFGAIGVFYFANRRGLGAFGSSAITSWIFWLILNLAMASTGPNPLLAIGVELFALVVGMIVAYLLLPRSNAGRGRPLF